MTIAAGFLCSDGIVLCADTQLTANYKQQGQKVWLHAYDDVCVGVTGAGDYVLLKLANQQIEQRVRSGMDTDTILHGVVEPVLASIYDDHIDKAPDWKVNQCGYDLALIIAIRTTSTVRLFESSRTSLAPVMDYRCVGTGSPVGNYIAGTMFSQQLPAHWGQALAAYLIQQTKTHGEDCGGNTNIVLIPNDGPAVFLSPTKIAQSEAIGTRIHERLGALLFATVEPLEEETFDELVCQFVDAVVRARVDLLEQRDQA